MPASHIAPPSPPHAHECPQLYPPHAPASRRTIPASLSAAMAETYGSCPLPFHRPSWARGKRREKAGPLGLILYLTPKTPTPASIKALYPLSRLASSPSSPLSRYARRGSG